MKKILCIALGNWWNSHDELVSGPLYHETCIVLKEVYEDGRLGYILLEYNSPEPFCAELFIPLSNSSAKIAEMAMADELVEA